MCAPAPAPAPTSQNVTQTSIPEYAQPYVERMLGKSEALSNAPYQAYGGERIAGFTPMQQQAQQATANIGPSQQLGLATQMAGLAGLRSGNISYTPSDFGNQYNAPSQYQTGRFGVQGVGPSQLQQFQMGPSERVSTDSFAQPGAMEAYMSPYVQGAVAPELREAARQSAIQGQQSQAQAVQQGAFGGARSGIVEAERQRNLAMQQGDIYGKGMQSAFAQAQQQFNAEQQARLAAQQANQQAGLTVGGQNLGALLGVQQLGAGQSMQAQLANQAAAQQAQQMREASRQFGYGQQMSAAQQQAQYGLSGQQAAEQSRQYGASLGLQGLSQAGQMASTLGQLGQTQFGQQKDVIGMQQAVGGQQQALEQQRLQQQYQDFLTQRGYPQQQLAFMSDMLRGLPLSQSTQSMYQAPPSLGAQALGAFGTYVGGQKAGVFKEGGLTGLAIHHLSKG